MFHSGQENMVKTCTEENYIKLVLYWTKLQESCWFNSQQIHISPSSAPTGTKQLSVTNCTTLIRKHTLMLQSCTFMSAWWKIDPALILFSNEAGFHFTGYINSQNNRYWSPKTLILIHEVPLYESMVCVWCVMSAIGVLDLVFVIWDHIHINMLHTFWYHFLITCQIRREHVPFLVTQCNTSH